MLKKSEENAGYPNEYEKKVRVETYGEEVIEKTVKHSGNSGRIYVPRSWSGCLVKVIRMN